ncbi:MAG: helix-turn-helix transcriptional regulator [Nitrososphaerales archaeon]|nr:helix-turn-helix transcriptional regulator [Nitrososphaerales archaeon]
MKENRKEHDPSYLYAILSHPLRRRIIEMMGKKGSVNFTEFKLSLKIRVGTLYYHLDALRGLIAQDKDRKYVLTDTGLDLYNILTSGRHKDISTKLSLPAIKPASRMEKLVKNIFLPNEFFRLVYGSKLGIIGVVLVLSLGSYIISQARFEPLLLFFNRTTKSIEIIALEFFLGWIFLFVICDLLSTILFKRKGDDLYLLLGTAYSFIPLLIFPFLQYLDMILELNLIIFRDAILTRILLSLLQGWALVFLTSAIGQSKGLRIDKAVLIGLIVAYINIMMIYIVGVSV